MDDTNEWGEIPPKEGVMATKQVTTHPIQAASAENVASGVFGEGNYAYPTDTRVCTVFITDTLLTTVKAVKEQLVTLVEGGVIECFSRDQHDIRFGRFTVSGPPSEIVKIKGVRSLSWQSDDFENKTDS